MGYPVAYRSGSSIYGVGGFQGSTVESLPGVFPGVDAPANDNVRVPANDNIPPARPSMSGPTALSRGAIGAAAAVARMMGGNVGRAARAASALAQAWPNKQNEPGDHYPGVYPYGTQLPAYANGWELFCTGPMPGANVCGPFLVGAAVSCNLGGQASNPAGLCVNENTDWPNYSSYSVVYEYLSGFGNIQRYYLARYVRRAGEQSTNDPAEMPITKPGHRPAYMPAIAPGVIPPAQPMQSPAFQPVKGVYAGRNDEWHQVGPLPQPRVVARVVPRRPPLKGEKERKGVSTRAVIQGVRSLANAITESDDFLEAIWKAIPYKLRTNPACKHNNVANKTVCPSSPEWKSVKAHPELWRPVRQTPQTMLKDVYNNWDAIDWPKALYNQQQNDAQDRSIGRPASETNRNFADSPYTGGTGFRGFWGPAM